MAIEIKVPALPESVQDATIATWHKQAGDTVERDENLVDIETDKVVLEVVAPATGVLEEILHDSGDTVTAEQVIGKVTEGNGKAAAPKASKAKSEPAKAAKSESAPSADASAGAEVDASPSVRRFMSENGINPSQVKGSGKGGKITMEDAKRALSGGSSAPATTTAVEIDSSERPEKRVPMTRLRSRIAERLLSAQQNAAILTTFNEINMKPVMDLRKRYKEEFEKAHGIKLGFMSFFAKAAIEALKRFPAVNASIDGGDIVYHGFYDIGVAVSTPKGLVVPIVRNAHNMGLADLEKSIADLGIKARDGQLSIEEMTGGTFTISNGGVFGSLLSTPILNPPQTGILGMHKIEERAVVENGEIVIRPMMYVALSYDHRLIDGSESVRFLVTIKQLLEDPARLLLDI